jgi:DNA invertase Pin-like site-specific DNA recombinase
MKKAMIRAFVYLRVSGKGQVDGDGFDRQLIACQTFAEQVDIEIVEVFREEGVSGTKELDDRPALSTLFAALEENGIKTIIVEKLDRLARDLLIQETIVSDMLKKGYTLLSVSEPDLCSQDPSRILVRQVFGAISQYEKAMIVLKLKGARMREKIKDGLAKGFTGDDALKNGKCEGRHAFGEKPEEKDALGDMMVWHRAGLTGQAIAANLNSAGFKTRSGKPWNRSTVAKIVARSKRAA